MSTPLDDFLSALFGSEDEDLLALGSEDEDLLALEPPKFFGLPPMPVDVVTMRKEAGRLRRQCAHLLVPIPPVSGVLTVTQAFDFWISRYLASGNALHLKMVQYHLAMLRLRRSSFLVQFKPGDGDAPATAFPVRASIGTATPDGTRASLSAPVPFGFEARFANSSGLSWWREFRIERTSSGAFRSLDPVFELLPEETIR